MVDGQVPGLDAAILAGVVVPGEDGPARELQVRQGPLDVVTQAQDGRGRGQKIALAREQMRFRLGVMLKPAPWLKIYAQTQDSREYLSDRQDFPGVLGAEGDDAFDLRQGYVEISNYDKCPWGLKIGRQVLAYGDERLVGSSEWNNFGRTFDAVKLRYQQKDWWVEGFASTVPVITRGKYNQSDLFNGTENHREQVFSGLYFSTTALSVQTTDVYAFHLHENTNALYQPAAIGDTNFFTFGARVKSKPGAFHHEPAAVHDGKAMADGKTTRTIRGVKFNADKIKLIR